MSSLIKTALLSVSLVAGAAVAAHAQSVASLPPGAAAAPAPVTSPVGPSVAYPGPNPGSGYYGGTVSEQQAITPSPKYVGPAPGASDGSAPPHFDKPTGYDQDTSLHPYTSNMGPKPN
jgi:hypothetical protein